MKINQPQPGFVPFDVTIETPEEAAVLLTALAFHDNNKIKETIKGRRYMTDIIRYKIDWDALDPASSRADEGGIMPLYSALTRSLE